eukprot:tig00021073_g18040.t1
MKSLDRTNILRLLGLNAPPLTLACRATSSRAADAAPLSSFPTPQALRDIFFKYNRKTVCWIDEWFGMTIDDIRRYEDETKAALDSIKYNTEDGEGEHADGHDHKHKHKH